MKLSKKIIAGALAALMAISMMPLTALASDVTDLTDQMYWFEQQMLDGNIYTNVAPAYKAYVDANEAFDAYTYGKSDNAQLVAAKNALEAARANMVVWTKPTASATTTYHSNTDDGVDRAARYSVNLLASEYGPNRMGGAEGTGDTIAYDNTVANARIRVYYAQNVLLYDGETTPQFPVVYSNQVVGSKNKSRYTHTVYPASEVGEKSRSNNASTEFVLENDKYSDHTNCWIGRDKNDSRIDYSYLYQQSAKVGGDSTNSHNHWSERYYTENYLWSGSDSATDYYANALKYTATPTNAFETYYIIWAHRTSSNEQISGDAITGDDYGAGAATVATYVYNYAGIAGKLAAMKNLNVGAYREGGLVSYFENADVLTQSWSDMMNNASAANTAYSNISFASATADNANQYAALRSAMNHSGTITDLGTYSVSDVINAGGVLVDADNDGTAETQLDGYTDFEAAYNSAKSVMADLANHLDSSSNYTNGSGAATAAANLLTAFGELAVPAAPEPEAENSYNLTLTDSVDVNFFIDEDYYEEKGGTKITYSYLTTTDDKSAERNEYSASFADLGANGQLTISAAPAQIAEKCIINVYNDSDVLVDTIEASIEDYCKAIINGEFDQKDKDVAQALLNYGALANEYFAYADISETDNYAVAHSEDYKNAVDAESFKSKAKASVVPGVDQSGAALNITGISYVALLDPELRFYVNQTNDVWCYYTNLSISDTSLTAEWIKTDKGNCVRVTGLKASDFAKTFTLTIGTTEVTYNGYAYLYTVLREGSTVDNNLKDLAKGIYRYAAACEAKFA